MAYISNPGATLTFTAGSKTVNVAGTNPILEDVRAGDMALDPNGVPLALDARNATTLTLKRNAPTSGTFTFEIMWGPSRSLVAQATATTREVWAQITAWADRGLSIPVIAVQNAPPSTPADGDRYLVGTAGSGAWAGNSNRFATWSATSGRWEFTVPVAGWQATYNDGLGRPVRLQFTGSVWATPVTIASDVAVTPTGEIAATNLQAALAELDDEKVHKTGTQLLQGPLIISKSTALGVGGALRLDNDAGNIGDAVAVEAWALGSMRGRIAAVISGSPFGVDWVWQNGSGVEYARMTQFGSLRTAGLKTTDAVASSPSDLSKHLDLYGGVYGISVTASRLNYVVGSGNTHNFGVGGSDRLVVSGAGVAANTTLSANNGSTAGGTIALGTSTNSVLSAATGAELLVNAAGYSTVTAYGTWNFQARIAAAAPSFNPYTTNVMAAAVQGSGPFGGGMMQNDSGLVGAWWIENPGGGATDMVFGAGGGSGLTEMLRLRSSGTAQFRNDVRIGTGWNFQNSGIWAVEGAGGSITTKFTDFNAHYWRDNAGNIMAALSNGAFELVKSAAGTVGPVVRLINSGGSIGDAATVEFWSVGTRRGYISPQVSASPFQADWLIGNDTYGSRFLFGQAGALRLIAHGAGTLVTDASGNVTASSDITLKENVQPWTKGLAAVLALDPISYNWTEASGFDRLNRYHGFSAQDVEEVLPEAVGMDENGHLTLMERPILAAYANAIKELHAKLVDAMARIEALENA